MTLSLVDGVVVRAAEVVGIGVVEVGVTLIVAPAVVVGVVEVLVVGVVEVVIGVVETEVLWVGVVEVVAAREMVIVKIGHNMGAGVDEVVDHITIKLMAGVVVQVVVAVGVGVVEVAVVMKVAAAGDMVIVKIGRNVAVDVDVDRVVGHITTIKGIQIIEMAMILPLEAGVVLQVVVEVGDGVMEVVMTMLAAPVVVVGAVAMEDGVVE